MRNRLLIIAPLALMLASACTGKNARTSSGEAVTEAVADQTEENIPAAQPVVFPTDSIHWEDSLTMGNSRGTVTLAVAYPAGGDSPLLDSLRTWVAARLLLSPVERNVQKLPDATPLADGKAIVAEAGKKLLDFCREDFEGFDSITPSYPISYEFNYDISPIYMTGKAITYNSMRYSYLAGAHGSTVSDAQTFSLADGTALTADKMFKPDSLAAVTAMVKKAVYEQYFLSSYEESGDTPMSFRDCLLIDPDEMKLPVFPPYFMADGVVFVYQQYEIACYAAGMPACIIPYSTLLPYMTPMAAGLVPDSK